MKVYELAADLAVEDSVVLEQCERLGINAADRNSELAEADQLRLQFELAGDEVLETGLHAGRVSGGSTPGRRVEAVPAVALSGAAGKFSGHSAPGEASALPPTAVGSLPGFVDGQGSDTHSMPTGSSTRFAGDDSSQAGSPDHPPTEAVGIRGRSARSAGRMWDHSVTTAAVAAVLAVGVAVGANMLDEAALILPLWIILAVLLIVVVVSANHARYRITTHPGLRRGLVPAVVLLAAGAVGILTMGVAIWTIVRTAPADQAPLGIGDYQSVDRLRWGYQRLGAIADTGWERPAKDAGTCWRSEPDQEDPRRQERVEIGTKRVDCTATHGYEVIGVYAYDRKADSIYPDVDTLTAESLRRCEPVRGQLKGVPAGTTFAAEYPTEAGWQNGDHDVSCVAVADKSGTLLPE